MAGTRRRSREWLTVDRSDDGSAVYVRGEVYVRNWINGKCSGSQKFCFAVFVGDSDEVRYARITKTRAYVVVDEGPNGEPIWETWKIRNHVSYELIFDHSPTGFQQL